MRHRGAHVGNFHLVEKAGGGTLTGEDEETLVPLASQAAAATANARTYRAERQARADLFREATASGDRSAVGRTGSQGSAPVSFPEGRHQRAVSLSPASCAGSASPPALSLRRASKESSSAPMSPPVARRARRQPRL